MNTHNPRDFATDKHQSVDDEPYGGGGGMVLKPEPLFALWQARRLEKAHCIYLTADGEKLDHRLSVELSLQEHLVLLCGHYKGVDERVRTRLIDREVSIGDYVLTGGEPAALVLIDAVVRLVPGVLGNFSSALEDSFQDALLDCPWYTRPVHGLEPREVGAACAPSSWSHGGGGVACHLCCVPEPPRLPW